MSTLSGLNERRFGHPPPRLLVTICVRAGDLASADGHVASGTFSTITVWPSDACSPSAITRPIVSVGPPAGNGTTSTTARLGCLKYRNMAMLMEDRLMARIRETERVALPLKLARCRRRGCGRVTPWYGSSRSQRLGLVAYATATKQVNSRGRASIFRSCADVSDSLRIIPRPS